MARELFYAASKNLLTPIERSCGIENAQEVSNIFETLGLPIPALNQFSKTNEGGYLIFLEPFGVTMRLTGNNFVPYCNDAILQPLARFSTRFYRVDLNAGIETPIQPSGYSDHIFPTLYRHKLRIDDCKPENAGYLPNAERTPVVLDTPAVYSTPQSTQGTAPIQDLLFKPLRDTFAAAMREKNPRVFWRECADAKASGFLISGWTDYNLHTKFDIDPDLIPAFRRKIVRPARSYKKQIELVAR